MSSLIARVCKRTLGCSQINFYCLSNNLHSLRGLSQDGYYTVLCILESLAIHQVKMKEIMTLSVFEYMIFISIDIYNFVFPF